MLDRLKLLRIAVLSVVVLSIAAACGGDDGDDGSAPEPVTQFTLVAQLTTFDQNAFSIPVGEEVTVTYMNLDNGISHNFHVIVSPERNFATVITTGPINQVITFTINEPGTYTFQCDVHPDVMTGTLTVQ